MAREQLSQTLALPVSRTLINRLHLLTSNPTHGVFSRQLSCCLRWGNQRKKREMKQRVWGKNMDECLAYETGRAVQSERENSDCAEDNTPAARMSSQL